MKKNIQIFCLALALVSLTCSCSVFQTSKGSTSSAQHTSSAVAQQDPTYTIPDFPYLPIPRELEYDPHDSLVFETTNFKTGILILSGRVDAASLIEFFINNLSANGWTKKGSIKTKKSIIFFEKPNKSCTIQIDDQTLTTAVQIVIIEIKKDQLAHQGAPVEQNIDAPEKGL